MGRVGEIVDFCICRLSGSSDSGDVVCCCGPSLHLYFYSSVFSSGFNVLCRIICLLFVTCCSFVHVAKQP